jgi:hypothetical protein
VEVIAENDRVLELVGQYTLVRIAVLPDARFSQEVESRPLHHLGCPFHSIGTEEDRRAKDTLKSLYQPAVFLAAPAHPKCVQHFSPRAEANYLTLLLDGQCGQADWDEPHGGPLWEPLCYAQIGGLTIATFATLGLVPVLYSFVVLDLKLIRWEQTEKPISAPSGLANPEVTGVAEVVA